MSAPVLVLLTFPRALAVLAAWCGLRCGPELRGKVACVAMRGASP